MLTYCSIPPTTRSVKLSHPIRIPPLVCAIINDCSITLRYYIGKTKLYSRPDNIRLAKPLRADILIVTSKSAHTKLLNLLQKSTNMLSQKSLVNSLQLDNGDWRKVYLLPRQTTIESSLWSFQYKILTDTLYSNERLFNPKQAGLFRIWILPLPPCNFPI